MRHLSLLTLILKIGTSSAGLWGWSRCLSIRGGSYPPADSRDSSDYGHYPPPDLPPDLPPYGDDPYYPSQRQPNNDQPPPLPNQQQHQGHPHLPPSYGEPQMDPRQDPRSGPMQPPPSNYNDQSLFQEEADAGDETGESPSWGDVDNNDNGIDWSAINKEFILKGLARLYRKKILPVELASRYGHFYSAPLSPADFVAPPMVLLLGQYSVGKTSFIKYLLGRDFPGIRVGPEPTTGMRRSLLAFSIF